MKLWIKTQDKKRILSADNVLIKGRSLKVINQQYPFGVLLGKYRDIEKTQTVFDSIYSKLKAGNSQDCIFEIPEDY